MVKISLKGKGIRKCKVNVEFVGEVYVIVLFNNIIILLINKNGDVIFWFLVGKMGFRGFKKNIFYVV